MKWQLLVVLFVNIARSNAYGQCIISRDSIGQVTTSCQGKSGPIRYLGSEFLTFPIWQSGALRLGPTGRQINGRICYNVYTNQVFAQLEDSTTTEVFPDAFTINGALFLKQALNGSTRHRMAYYLLRYEGKIKLLEGLKCTLDLFSTPLTGLGNIAPYLGSNKTSPYYAQYKKQSSYYLQKGSSRMKPIELTKTSVLSVLYEQAEPLNSFIPNEQLTMHELIGVLRLYDSLMTVAPRSPILLNDDLVFRETLHDYIQYPSQAWNEGVYSRVYIGFDIDSLGQIKDIMPLSPANMGYSFTEAALKALQRLPTLSASYAGHYVLPIAFSYTNLSDKDHVHYTPRNLLSSERMANRQLLNELQVPVIVNRGSLLDHPIQEVWGYYK